MKKQRMGGRTQAAVQVKGQNTPWPEDARMNPYLSETFEVINDKLSCQKPFTAHTKAIGGMALHAKK